jgi:hypothetical protein
LFDVFRFGEGRRRQCFPLGDHESLRKMIRLSDFEKAAKRYGWTVMVAGISAFAFFDVMLWVSVLLLKPHVGAIRQWAQAVGPIAQVLFPLAVFAASSPIPLVFLIATIRRARCKSLLHCPECSKFNGDAESVKHIRGCGKCRHCDSQFVPESELNLDVRSKIKLPVWLYSLALCAFGVVFLIYAIPQPRPVQFVFAAVALANFLVAGYVFLKRNTESDKDAAQLLRIRGQRGHEPDLESLFKARRGSGVRSFG